MEVEARSGAGGGNPTSVRWDSDIPDLLHKSSPEQMRLYQAPVTRVSSAFEVEQSMGPSSFSSFGPSKHPSLIRYMLIISAPFNDF